MSLRAAASRGASNSVVAKKVKFGNMGRTNISRVGGNFAAWAYERLSVICRVNFDEESSLERSFKVSIFKSGR